VWRVRLDREDEVGQQKAKRHFDHDDVELLEDVLDLVPDLDVVAFALKTARKTIDYPLQSHDDLVPLFGEKRKHRFKDRELTFEQAVRFLPKEFFPVVSERDFAGKLLIAFQRGMLFHVQTELAEGPSGVGSETLLPSPRAPSPGEIVA
jgi:hypothetical protein